MYIGKVDKVTQAERKLAGLCQICGAKTGPSSTPVGSDLYRNHPCDQRNIEWVDVDEKCLNYITRWGSMSREEVKAASSSRLREYPRGA